MFDYKLNWKEKQWFEYMGGGLLPADDEWALTFRILEGQIIEAMNQCYEMGR